MWYKAKGNYNLISSPFLSTTFCRLSIQSKVAEESRLNVVHMIVICYKPYKWRKAKIDVYPIVNNVLCMLR